MVATPVGKKKVPYQFGKGQAPSNQGINPKIGALNTMKKKRQQKN